VLFVNNYLQKIKKINYQCSQKWLVFFVDYVKRTKDIRNYNRLVMGPPLVVHELDGDMLR